MQGVGFRPFVFRLASELQLQGCVSNSNLGLFIEVEGPPPALRLFQQRVVVEKPPHAFIQSLESSWLDPVGFTDFQIRPSENSGARAALILPDIATCPDCLREILDPTNRRHGYPFTNCTHCGPRFSIIEALPYDRDNTSMKPFTMCPRCRAEYDDPRDRRFHAQPNACPDCGPRVELWDRAGRSLCAGAEAIERAAAALQDKRIVAVKGLGGFHLMTLATDEPAVQRLRDVKQREAKPLAVMFPSLSQVRAVAEVSAIEERLLQSSEAPIVLLTRKTDAIAREAIAHAVAPGNPNLGVMLPYTPLHHLLLSKVGSPLVATSGNLSDEPICIDEHDALSRLGAIADLFLVHNRPIVRHVDDSIVRVVLGHEMVLRRARGFAPLPIRVLGSASGALPSEIPRGTILAMGAHLKNAVALAMGDQVFVSQHIGDLETTQAYDAFCRASSDLARIYETTPSIVVADAHPDYLSTHFAEALTAPDGTPQGRESTGGAKPRLIRVQHHEAHVFSCMADNEVAPPCLGVSWDGTGYGIDGRVWGGEFFGVTDADCRRIGHLREFRIPGGDRAVREPRRSALGLLFAWKGESALDRTDVPWISSLQRADRTTLKQMLRAGLNSPWTTSMGRLFDAVAALIGLCERSQFEGQAAMTLEFTLPATPSAATYAFDLGTDANAVIVLDWAPVIEAILLDLNSGVARSEISTRFHNALANAIVAVAQKVGHERVALSGGCFQNRYLTEATVNRLKDAGFRPYWHQRVPPNDGGIALGQVMAARRKLMN